MKQRQAMFRTGLEPGTSGFQVWRPKHSATLPPYLSSCHNYKMSFILIVVYAGQQARILGENYTIEDEEDSRVGTVRINPCVSIFYLSFISTSKTESTRKSSNIKVGQKSSTRTI